MPYKLLYSNRLFENAEKITLFCNQSSYDFQQKKYLFDILIDAGKLSGLLLPEHGLFSELQDQENVASIKYKGIPCFSMYDKKMNHTGPNIESLANTDLLIIDINDVGVRYFTYATHMFALLNYVSSCHPDLQVIIIDRANPIGKKVEGTIIDERYTSFLGVSGMIHRHGMSTGELCEWYIKFKKITLQFAKIRYNHSWQSKHFISPSPNLPNAASLFVYPGQCFWEATTFSEGRGTTRPFELFGHPDLTNMQLENISFLFNRRFNGMAFLRPTSFIPIFHKHSGVVCHGWHLSVEDHSKYHTLIGTLIIMRWVKKYFSGDDFWRQGSYEFDSKATAAQLLIGDDELINFVNGDNDEEAIWEKMTVAQHVWV